jgi:hypothetical protein
MDEAHADQVLLVSPLGHTADVQDQPIDMQIHFDISECAVGKAFMGTNQAAVQADVNHIAGVLFATVDQCASCISHGIAVADSPLAAGLLLDRRVSKIGDSKSSHFLPLRKAQLRISSAISLKINCSILKIETLVSLPAQERWLTSRASFGSDLARFGKRV